MKKIYRDKILNVEDTNVFDSVFLFEYISKIQDAWSTKIIHIWELLEAYKNTEIEKRLSEKPAMWSEVYAPKDELEIFTRLFEEAVKSNQKVHVVWVTLGEEIQMLEKYYEELWFLREDINAFDVDFSVPLITVSCHIENLMWRGSDYKAQRDAIFFCPPIRESWQNKALFKWITRWVIAGIELWDFTQQKQEFIANCVRQEKILPIHIGKVLQYNLEDIGFVAELAELRVKY